MILQWLKSLKTTNRSDVLNEPLCKLLCVKASQFFLKVVMHVWLCEVTSFQDGQIAHARVVKFTYELKLISTWKDLHKASLWNRGKRQLAILAFSWANITPSFILNLSMARLCLWCTIVDVVTTIGIRCAVSLYVEWHRSLKMALLMALQRSTLLLSFLRLTEKQGTIVSGPISRRNAMASLSWSQNVHVNLV